jgi:hypothetical protein
LPIWATAARAILKSASTGASRRAPMLVGRGHSRDAATIRLGACLRFVADAMTRGTARWARKESSEAAATAACDRTSTIVGRVLCNRLQGATGS